MQVSLTENSPLAPLQDFLILILYARVCDFTASQKSSQPNLLQRGYRTLPRLGTSLNIFQSRGIKIIIKKLNLQYQRI